MRYLFSFLVFFFSAASVYSQATFSPPLNRVQIEGRRTHHKIKIDGILDEEEWKSVTPVGSFIQVEPFQGLAPTFNTEVKILFDDTFLYIGAFCKDSIRGIRDLRVQDLSRDFEGDSGDIFAIRIDAFNKKRNCLIFDTNPYGVQKDAQVFDDQNFEINWNALWQVKTSITSKGWYAEFAIPFKSIRYPKPTGSKLSVWGIKFQRINRRLNEFSAFPAFPRTVDGARMSYAAELNKLELPSPHSNLQLLPYGLYVNNRQALHDTVQKTRKLKFGLDAKWALTTHSQVDLTINPDFAQADVDKQVINLSRSSILLPEKRQFFLDNSGLFTAGLPGSQYRSDFIQPFYSRTIGLNTAGQPQPIEGGMRYVDRTEGRTIGAMYLRQQGSDSIKATDFSVLRYQKSYGQQNNAGFLLTNKYEETARSNISHIANTTLTFNGINRLTPNFTTNYMVSGSREGQNSTNGLAALANFHYENNKFYLNTEHYIVTDHYNPAMGYFARSGVVYTNLSFMPHIRGKWLGKNIREYHPSLFIDIYQNIHGLSSQEQSYGFNTVALEFNNGGNFFVVDILNKQSITTAFRPVNATISPGNYSFWQHIIGYRSDQSKHFSAELNSTIGHYFNGSQVEYSVNARYTPDPHAVFFVNYDHNRLDHLGLYKQNIMAKLLAAGARIYWNPRLFFNGLLQYNSIDTSLNYNLRISWEYHPLSFIYLVLTDINDKSRAFNERQFINKISFVKQF